ncbi:MAG TPA: alpha-glucosidase C-terminal domain-containing protein, partial [Actinomycetota bacterium]|nr:alpha-glucosidase C-terminal domain-containing protein [Actinomycetota bacterium]
DFETSNWAWDPVANAYYWHRFYSHQPDLNFDNPAVRKAMMEVLDFWFDMGVDGLRLDAVPYLFEREGTNGENLKETHEFLKELRGHVEERYGGEKMLLAEANQWPEDAAAYFGDGDECHMAFHFPLMPRMFMATRLEDRFPIIDILEQTPAVPDNAQWALFLRNHDELTLEMVTDEERDYMYRVYAADPQARINLGIRRRLAPLLGNNRRMIEMMNGLLFSLPGTPVMYYGDEIGMGDNIYLGDRNGVRTPMQWSADRNAGFSRANPQKLFLPVIIDPEYHAEALNVEAQRANPHSLLWWTKRLIALRKQSKALSRGTLEFLYPENPKVLAYLREHDGERVLVVANLSRHAQYVELGLRDYAGMVPVEMFGGTEFPPIGELPYLVTLGPHAFYWLALEDRDGEAAAGHGDGYPVLEVSGSWTDVLAKRGGRGPLERTLPGWLRTRRWFGAKGRKIKAVDIDDTVPLSRTRGAASGVMAVLTVEYTEGEPETYALPLVWRHFEDGHEPPTVIARVKCRDGEGLLFDGLSDPELCKALLSAVASRRTLRGAHGELTGTPTRAFRATRGSSADELEVEWIGAEQSNTSVVFGDRIVMKLIRHLTDGVNPDLEVGRYLSEQTPFDRLPRVSGAIEYRRGRAEPSTVAILTEYVDNEGDAWSFTLGQLGLFVERALVAQDDHPLTLPHG